MAHLVQGRGRSQRITVGGVSHVLKGCVVVKLQVANPETISGIQADGIPQYEIGWSPEHGWRVQVAIHNSIMFVDHGLAVFESCDSPEHAFALGNEWVKETLQIRAHSAQSLPGFPS
jgi:hypothetical protein